MEDVVIPVLLGLAKKAVQVAGVKLVDVLEGAEPTALFVDGEDHWSWLPWRRGCEVSVVFTPEDDWAAEWLDETQPVLVAIEDVATGEPVLVALTTIGLGFELHLRPGIYMVGAVVYLDVDPEMWAPELADGGGVGIIEVCDSGWLSAELPLLAIPSREEVQAALEAYAAQLEPQGSLELVEAGQLTSVSGDRCHATTRKKRRCRNPVASDSPNLCGTHRAQLEAGQ